MVDEDGDINLDERVTTTRWSETPIKDVNQWMNELSEKLNIMVLDLVKME